MEDHRKSVLHYHLQVLLQWKKSKPDFGIKSCEQNISSIPTCNSTTKGKGQSSCVDINNCYNTCNSQVGLPNHAEGKSTNIEPSLLQVVRQSGNWLDDQTIKTSMDILKNHYSPRDKIICSISLSLEQLKPYKSFCFFLVAVICALRQSAHGFSVVLIFYHVYGKNP